MKKKKIEDAKILIVLANNFEDEDGKYESFDTPKIQKFSLKEFEVILDQIKPVTKEISDFKKKVWKVFP